MNQKNMSMVKILLHLEGTAVLVTTLIAYAQFDYSWWTFALLILWPDIAILPYAINKQLGGIIYNLLHTYSLPVVLLAASLLWSLPYSIQFALIWLAHIGMDRLFGYGLKYMDDFKHTHLTNV